MSSTIPPQLAGLLTASEGAARDAAWEVFLEEYSRLLLRTVHRTSPDRDEAMDHYVYILDRLREGDCQRLRDFAADGAGKFTTWLVVVARRLCVDNHRRLRGRPQAETENPRVIAERVARRNLADRVAEEFDFDRIQDEHSPSPDAHLLGEERRDALIGALEQLPVTDQLLLTLRFEDGHGPGKIAGILGLPTRFHVHRRLRSALATLRRALEERGITEP